MPVRFLALVLFLSPVALAGQRTQKPPLHGRHWVAITGKPLAATAGAMIFQKGGNPVDAACAMLAAVTTMWDVLSWGGETQALIYNPQTKKVIAINALGVAPTGATPAFYRSKGMHFPPEYGPLAAITPGTPGGLMTMLAEYGKLSLRDVLEPAIRMADGYPIEAETANSIERNKGWGDGGLHATAVVAGPGDARGAEYPRDLGSKGDGLQRRALHPHRVPGDEPRVRGPRLLLRRPGVPAGRADPGLALEGLRAAAGAPDQSRPQRSGHQAGRSLSLPGGDEPLPGPAPRLAPAGAHPSDVRRREPDGGAAAGGGRARGVRRTVHSRHDVDRGRGHLRMGRVDHAVGGVDSSRPRGPHRGRREPAGAAIRRRFPRQSIQRDRAGEPPARHAYAEPRAEGREAVPGVRGAGG